MIEEIRESDSLQPESTIILKHFVKSYKKTLLRIASVCLTKRVRVFGCKHPRQCASLPAYQDKTYARAHIVLRHEIRENKRGLDFTKRSWGRRGWRHEESMSCRFRRFLSSLRSWKWLQNNDPGPVIKGRKGRKGGERLEIEKHF